jgi:hypothetical protein
MAAGQDAALKALDDAFAEQLKARFGVLCSNIAGGTETKQAAGLFARGYSQLLAADEMARQIVKGQP